MSLIKFVPGHPLKSWLNPKTERGVPSKIAGKCLVAKEKISKNEVLVAKAGRIIDTATLLKFHDEIKGSEAQIADDLFIAPLGGNEIKDSMAYVNHSCEPNAGFGGNILVVAMRDIEPGEEITIDYAMDRTDSEFRLVCNCGASSCRKVITGGDWRKPEIQKKYAGYFSWYIEQKIKALNS